MKRSTHLAVALGICACGGAATTAQAAQFVGPLPPTNTNQQSHTITWATSGTGDGNFTWSLDGGTPVATTATSTTIGPLADGQHSFVVTEGGVGPDVSHNFTVDTVAPTAVPFVKSGTPGLLGWFTSDVVIGWNCSGDALACPTDVTLNTQGAGQVAAPSVSPVVDAAGNSSGPVASSNPVSIDKFAPAITIATRPSGDIQLGTPATTLVFSCDTADTSGLVACASPLGPSGTAFDYGTPGTRNAATAGLGTKNVTVGSLDKAGNASTQTITYRIVDTLPPTKPGAATPSEVTNQQTPTFTWSTSKDSGVGVTKYLVYIDGTASFQVNALTDGGVEPSEYRQSLPANALGVLCLRSHPDPSNPQKRICDEAGLSSGSHSWRVVATDARGNTASSDTLAFKVDTSAPPAPMLTGPTGLTNNRTPTFTAGGTAGLSYLWALDKTVDGSTTTVQSGGPVASGVITVASLDDGQYRMKVRQRNALGTPGEFATILFTVDGTPPPAPTGLQGPGTTGDGQPSFAWASGEAGAVFRWTVLSAAGDVRQGPGSLTGTSVRLPSALPAGNYIFRLVQVDGAGNASAPADASFAIVAPPPAQVVSVPPTPPPAAANKVTLATVNAAKLLPRRGFGVTSAPVLKWPRVRGATLYNVQLFRVDGTKFVKVLKAFPRGTSFKVPGAVLKPGQKYLWRVWPYYAAQKKYAAKVAGQSWFSVKPNAKLVVKRPIPKGRTKK